MDQTEQTFEPNIVTDHEFIFDENCMDIEKLQSPSRRSSTSRPSDNFHSFLQTAIQAILAFIFSFRLIVFSTFKKSITNNKEESNTKVGEKSEQRDQEAGISNDSQYSSSEVDFSEPENENEEIDIERQTSLTFAEDMGDKLPTHSKGMPSVMSLLQTDEIPSSCSDDEPTTSGQIPLPSLLQSNIMTSALPNFLHTINEEESDEVRSVTSSSLTSPRTVVDRRLSNLSLLSPTTDEESRGFSPDFSYHQTEEDNRSEPEEIGENRTTRQIEITQSASEDDRFDLLKELAKIGKSSSSQEMSNSDSESKNQVQLLVTQLLDRVEMPTAPMIPIIIQKHTNTPVSEMESEHEKKEDVQIPEILETLVKENEAVVEAVEEIFEEPDYALVPGDESDEEESSVKTVEEQGKVVIVEEIEPEEKSRVMTILESALDPDIIPPPQKAEIVTIPLTFSEPEDTKLADADRDQEEELVFNEERRKTVTMDDNSSLRSASITFDAKGEEQDLNESFASNPTDETILMQKTKDEMDASSNRPRSPFDLPPPPSSIAHPSRPPPPPPPLSTTEVIGNTTTTTTTHYTPKTKNWSETSEGSTVPATSAVLAAQPLPSILTGRSANSTYQPYSSSASSTATVMSAPYQAPPVPPPPPPSQPSHNSGTSVYQQQLSGGAGFAPSLPKSVSSSREDLLSEHATSRSTVREIPVHRAPSTAPSHGSLFDYRIMPTTTTTYHHVETPTDEYYRREVMTRTIITRSTEALSQTPLGRATSPLDRYLPYSTTTTSGDGRTREEKTVDYKITYHRDIEEEERRIRQDQEKRLKEEQDRRTREEESRRLWEQREREELQRLRDQQTMTERQLERSLAERERAEKDRIERDRIMRQQEEMHRREEWERMENARIGAEEAELARKRALDKERIEREKAEEERRTLERLQREKERLERERLEAEKREAERLEIERIERERIERERIEIERIERIKRERIEKERREKLKEKEEEDRLRKEREELERIERERRELEIRERHELEVQRREAEDRERQRLEDEAREMRRREEERREAELLAEVQRQAEERERARRWQEREELERLERIRAEQQRIDMERAEAERRERERKEEDRREIELLEAARRKKEARERERLEELDRERQREEEERRERERREQERRIAAERERQRRQEEEEEIARMNDLQRQAAVRKAQRSAELDLQLERDELDRKARQLSEMEIREKERRDRERLQEGAQLAELRDKERRNQEIRERERREAADREKNRIIDDRRSRDKLDILVRERSEKEKFELEKRRLLAEKEAMNKKKHHLLSSETLAKLTQPMYYTTREPEVTTKVERQVIERIDRNLWVEDVPYGGATQSAIGYLDNDENSRDRMYNQNDLSRNGSSRSRYHRAANKGQSRRDFFSSSQDSADPVAERFRKSTEDLANRARVEYRGPLLQKFHESEFRTTPLNDTDGLAYRRMGPSPYEQPFAKLLEETERRYAAYNTRSSNPSIYHSSRNYSTRYGDNIRDQQMTSDINARAESVVAYERESRRESPADVAHIRSRSADYLMDRRIREETEVPENQLQKTRIEPSATSPGESRISEYEMKFRKSTEKLTVPDWYRENRPQTGQATSSTYRYTTGLEPVTTTTTTTTKIQDRSNPNAAGHDIPRGMFDRYRDEIEDMRRSRSSLHQLAQEATTRQGSSLSIGGVVEQPLPGYTVSEVPKTWDMQTSRTSRVVEVADTFQGTSSHDYGNFTNRYGGRVTIEEVLDSIFQKVTSSSSRRTIDPSYPQADELFQGNTDGPGIYTNNYNVMRQVMKQPERAEHLLQNEEMFVRCTECHRTRDLSGARLQFVSCKHCYTYYCSRECRQRNWPIHSGRCSFARINTLCKDVIMKVREDEEGQQSMSKVAREGYAVDGRGSVNVRLSSPQMAQAYVSNGWRALSGIPWNHLLHYYNVATLIQEKKEPSLISLCKRYDPKEKFILSVSIIADIEHCPETPPPETHELSAVQFSSPRSRYEAIKMNPTPPYFSEVAHNV